MPSAPATCPNCRHAEPHAGGGIGVCLAPDCGCDDLASGGPSDADPTVTVELTLTPEAYAVLVAALDLHGRIAMGQWDEVVRFAPEVLGADSTLEEFRAAADDLMQTRCRHARPAELRVAPNASLGIAEAGREARIGCDIWRAVGGGMKDRADMRLTDAVRAHRVTRSGGGGNRH